MYPMIFPNPVASILCDEKKPTRSGPGKMFIAVIGRIQLVCQWLHGHVGLCLLPGYIEIKPSYI